MTLRPVEEDEFQAGYQNSLWPIIKEPYFQAVPTESLMRGASAELKLSYLQQRVMRDQRSLDGSVADLPACFRGKVGWAEADLLRFLLFARRDRVLNIVGPRGSGKTSLIYYVEDLLAHSPYKGKRVLAIVKGLHIHELCLKGKLIDDRDFIDQACEEFGTLKLLYANSPMGPAFGLALERLETAQTAGDFAKVMKEVLSRHPSIASPCLTFVVDNVDPLPSRVIDTAFAFFRVLYQGTELGSIFCLRKGNLYSDKDRKGAQSLFRPKWRLGPPKVEAWLEALPARMAREARVQWGRRDIMGPTGPLSPSLLEQGMARLVRMMISKRKAEDNVLPYLQHMACEDMRQLTALMPRILQHHSLPIASLFSRESDFEAQAAQFHPVRALMEGGGRVYADCPEVRNLLFFKSRAIPGWTSHLIYHRILRLLLGHNYVPLKLLFEQTRRLGYPDEATKEALNNLWESHIVRWSCHDDMLNNNNLPQKIWLSGAGTFFICNLLTYPDYLLNAVLDTPWKNRARLKARPPNFAASVEELFALFDFICEEEGKELGQLLKLRRTNADKAILDALLDDGLLSSAICEGIQSCKYHGFGSIVPGALEWAESADTDAKIKTCRKHVASLTERITKVRDAIGRWIRPVGDFDYEENQGTIVVQLSESGREVGVSIRAKGRGKDLIAFVSISGVESGVNASAAASFQASRDPEALEPANIYSCLLTPARRIERSSDLKAQALILDKADGRVGIFSVEQANNTIRLVRDILRKGEAVSESRTELTSMSSQQLQAVADYFRNKAAPDLITGSEAERKIRTRSAQEHIREMIFGVEWDHCNRAIQETISEVDHLLICSQEHGVPWEWLLLDPKYNNHSCRVLRWPFDLMKGVYWTLIEDSGAIEPGSYLTTVGLRSGKDETLTSVLDRIMTARYLHLVGDFQQDGIHVGDNGVRITREDIRAHIPPDIKAVVLSSCETAAQPTPTNYAVAVCEKWRCPCWAPLCRIVSDEVEQLDGHLRELVEGSPTGEISHFMVGKRDQMSILHGYVQYGLKRAWQGGSNDR